MKAKRPFEKIYIYLTGVDTKQDGTIMTIFAIDDYSQFVFNPAIDKQSPSVDEMKTVLPNLFYTIFENIFKDYNPDIHPNSIIFVTNLPEETYENIYKIIGEKHKIIHNDKETKQKLMPFISKIFG